MDNYGESTQHQVYYIPNNFGGESRLWGGRINTRHLIDAIILSLLIGAPIALPIITLAMRDMPFAYKSTALIVLVGPWFWLGIVGYNGDPISVFLRNLIRWKLEKSVMLYNPTPRLLGTDPVKAAYETNKYHDKLVGVVTDAIKRRDERKQAMEYVEGENFQFAYDPSIDGYADDSGDFVDPEIPMSARPFSINDEDDLTAFLALLEWEDMPTYTPGPENAPERLTEAVDANLEQEEDGHAAEAET